MRDRILAELKSNENRYISGEALSEKLGVTRAAVWKYIKELKAEGYQIASSSKRGYCFEDTADMLNESEIRLGLGTRMLGKNVVFFRSADSTNIQARNLAHDGCPDGTVVAADEQTSGRGRLGREWSSAPGRGIWMSVVLRPCIQPSEVQLITLAASAAVAAAIEAAEGMRPGIKWPNDIILDGKKVCGILTEMNCEMERVNFIILGIGVNVNHRSGDFPPPLADSAVSLKIHAEKLGRQDMAPWGFKRSNLIQKILIELETRYIKILNGDNAAIIEEWKRYSATIGREIRFMMKDTWHTGMAEDITPDGRLVVKCSGGQRTELLSGEISVRGMLGYV